MVLHDLRRGPYDQELQVSAMEYLVDVPLIPQATPYRYSSTEQLDGVVGTAQVFDVWN